MFKVRCLSRLRRQQRWRAGPAERKGKPFGHIWSIWVLTCTEQPRPPGPTHLSLCTLSAETHFAGTSPSLHHPGEHISARKQEDIFMKTVLSESEAQTQASTYFLITGTLSTKTRTHMPLLLTELTRGSSKYPGLGEQVWTPVQAVETSLRRFC